MIEMANDRKGGLPPCVQAPPPALVAKSFSAQFFLSKSRVAAREIVARGRLRGRIDSNAVPFRKSHVCPPAVPFLEQVHVSPSVQRCAQPEGAAGPPPPRLGFPHDA